MNKFNDSDIREALRRSEKKRPSVEVPGDFLDNIMDEIESEPEPKTIKLWRWVAAAACIMALVGIGCAVLFSDKTQESKMIAETPTSENTEIKEYNAFISDTITEPTDAPKPKVTAPEQKAKPAAKPKPAAEPQPSPNPNLRMERPQYAENESATVASDTAPSNIVATQDAADTGYAENQSKNDEPYLDPALMDKFILTMAEFQGISGIKSECSIANDTIFDESFYVFPVKQDYDVLGHFLLMASQYSNTMPGYIFNNSEQQILFSIDDVPNGMNYLWIAEQIGHSKIMIYSVHAPIDIKYESDCFQQFYNDLTFANFNTYY